MSCYFCGGSRIASIHSAPDRGARNCVSADVTADAYIEDVKYCPFCGEEL